MPWTGPNFIRHNEDYSGATVWQSDAAASILIQSVRHDYHDYDIANGIDACINKNGANTPAANIPFGGFKITGYGNGGNLPTATDDVARYGQTVTAASLNAGTNVLTLTRADGNVTVDLTPLVIGGSTADFAKLSTANEFAGINTFDQAPVSKAGFSLTPTSGPVTLWRIAADNSGKYSVIFSGTYNGSAIELIATGNNAGTAAIFGKTVAFTTDLANYVQTSGNYTVTGNWTLSGSWNFNSGSVVLPKQTTFGGTGGGWQTNIASNAWQMFSIATGAIYSVDTVAVEGTRIFAGANRVWTNGNAKVYASGTPTGGLDNDIAYVQSGGSKGVWSKISGVWTQIAS